MSARRLLNVGYTMAVEVAGRDTVEDALAEACLPEAARAKRDAEERRAAIIAAGGEVLGVG